MPVRPPPVQPGAGGRGADSTLRCLERDSRAKPFPRLRLRTRSPRPPGSGNQGCRGAGGGAAGAAEAPAAEPEPCPAHAGSGDPAVLTAARTTPSARGWPDLAAPLLVRRVTLRTPCLLCGPDRERRRPWLSPYSGGHTRDLSCSRGNEEEEEERIRGRRGQGGRVVSSPPAPPVSLSTPLSPQGPFSRSLRAWSCSSRTCRTQPVT